MHNFLLTRFIASNSYRRNTKLCLLQRNAFFIISSFTSKSNAQSQDPFTVSYLINSCGLSRKIAVQASKNLRLKNSDIADSVLNLLKNYGFSESQLSKIVKRLPRLLLSNPEKTLLPKLKFLQSTGVSSTDLPEVLICNPIFLTRSISQCLLHRYEMLRCVLSNDDEVTKTLKCSAWCWSICGLGNDVIPNTKLLRELGVPQRFISLLITSFPDVAIKKRTKFAEAVKLTKEMGFDPAKSSFVIAVQVFAKLKQSEWESKLEAYDRWGWSRDVTLSAFKKFPNCMLLSEKKIGKMMDFLVNKMGLSAVDIAGMPIILTFSLEKRIIPRCSVLQTLRSKGLVKKDLRPSSFLIISKKQFVDSYVSRFQDADLAQMRPSNVIQI